MNITCVVEDERDDRGEERKYDNRAEQKEKRRGEIEAQKEKNLIEKT